MRMFMIQLHSFVALGYQCCMDNDSTVITNRNLLALTRPVVLVGLMGAGKTTVGKRLAKDINLDFVDSDAEISEAADCSIADIFEIYGEAIFRDLEKRVMLRLLSQEPRVIATGGGAFMNPDIRHAVAKHAISIWLRADLEVLVDRVSRRNTRPLLEQGDKRAILTKLMDERNPVYGHADIIIDSDEGSHTAIVNQIVTRLQDYMHAQDAEPHP
jgi:shikimate kinase